MAESKPAVLAETAAPPLHLHTAKRVGANAPLIGLLALGHLVTDVNQGALSAVLPFAKTAHGLSSAQVGTLGLMSNLTSSIPIAAFVGARFLPTPRDRIFAIA
jgi:FSR family fosmidomycin resistance protein-like MFS transporter